MYQHVEYLPFGEVFLEERNTQQDRNTYLYNGKELDEETGLMYYGARFYDPLIGRWSVVDNYAEKYPSLSPYNYCANNPMLYTDPTGDTIVINLLSQYEMNELKAIGIDLSEIVHNKEENDGNFIIIAHGSPLTIRDDTGDKPTRMYSGKDVLEMLSENEYWNEAKENGMDINLTIAACHNATDPSEYFGEGTEPSTPIAQRVSEADPGIYVKAADGLTQPGIVRGDRVGEIGQKGKGGIVGIDNASKQFNDGGWVTYKAGRKLNKVIVGRPGKKSIGNGIKLFPKRPWVELKKYY